MRITNLLRVILAVFTATLLMTFAVYTLIMCAAPIMGMSTKEITNSPFTAQIKQMWVPDRTLNSQTIKVANYSLETRSPLNKEWKQIKRVKPVLSNQFYIEYVDSNNLTPKYLDFSKESFDLLAQTKAVELGDSITEVIDNPFPLCESRRYRINMESPLPFTL